MFVGLALWFVWVDAVVRHRRTRTASTGGPPPAAHRRRHPNAIDRCSGRASLGFVGFRTRAAPGKVRGRPKVYRRLLAALIVLVGSRGPPSVPAFPPADDARADFEGITTHGQTIQAAAGVRQLRPVAGSDEPFAAQALRFPG